jgi:hypothetical protein
MNLSTVLIGNLPPDSNKEEIGGILRRCGIYLNLEFMKFDTCVAVCVYKDNASARSAVKNSLKWIFVQIYDFEVNNLKLRGYALQVALLDQSLIGNIYQASQVGNVIYDSRERLHQGVMNIKVCNFQIIVSVFLSLLLAFILSNAMKF